VTRLHTVLLLVFGASLGAGCARNPSSIAVKPSGPSTVVSKSDIEMVDLPGGLFQMGSSEGNPDEAPPHRVSIAPFLMDKFEVTHEMFAKVQLPDPSHWQDSPKTPVERVRWNDAKAYCNERSRLEGLTPCYDEKTPDWDCNYGADGYRLPTEAEWEYAARAGSEIPNGYGAPETLRQYAWFLENSDRKTHPVGRKKPNAWGVCDLYGNVSEWCEDVYSPIYYKESPASNPTGPTSPDADVKRVMRGGNWNAGPETCRASYRRGERTGNTDACFATDYCGFRCVRRAHPVKPAQPPVASK
jgi:formylglycine-generating enzyme required for sulfatase activity